MIETEYVFREQLGKGSFSKVLRAYRTRDRALYACKITSFVGFRDEQIDENKKPSKNLRSWNNAITECRLLSSLRHSNIVQYKETFFDYKNQQLMVFMEYMNGDNLDELIKHRIKYNKILEEEGALQSPYFEESSIWRILI